jgi:copper chaperone
MNTQIEVENLKCIGCASTIIKALTQIKGVSLVEVDPETALVEVTYSEDASLSDIKATLTSLGYPEVDTVRGLNKLVTSAKSYVSCALGKLP